MDEIIRFDGVSFFYGKSETPALKNINMTIGRGEFVAVLGHNGSGKSTLGKLMNCVLTPTEGKVYTAGMDTSDEANVYEIRRRAGMIFQNPDNQLVATVVEDDVAFAPENLGLPREEIRRRVDESLKAVGMYDYRDHTPANLSGGQKQRVAIAGVLAMEPECLIMDEATSMLDPVGRREVTAIAHRLNEERGMTVICITHHMSEAVSADRVIVLKSGEILLDGTPKEVFAQRERIEESGLIPPQPSQLANALRDEGFDIPAGVLTAEECIDAVKALLKG
ncbi:MAG: energy-coupling factor transporter ATPase [Clostridia bacterium]|nr:energy-coupling factor transporter ATPase [Clostridia bacterium]